MSRSRLARAGAVIALAALLALGCALDARSRRAARELDEPIAQATAALVGPELALHSASRWLRHPTRSEPWAAATDAPGAMDLDPAGAMAAPPREALAEGAVHVTLRVARRAAP